MASNRRQRRVQCGQKRKFDKDGAFSEATRLRRLWPGQSLDGYLCDHCGQYHVGHRPKKVQKMIDSRRKKEPRG